MRHKALKSGVRFSRNHCFEGSTQARHNCKATSSLNYSTRAQDSTKSGLQFQLHSLCHPDNCFQLREKHGARPQHLLLQVQESSRTRCLQVDLQCNLAQDKQSSHYCFYLDNVDTDVPKLPAAAHIGSWITLT